MKSLFCYWSTKLFIINAKIQIMIHTNGVEGQSVWFVWTSELRPSVLRWQHHGDWKFRYQIILLCFQNECVTEPDTGQVPRLKGFVGGKKSRQMLVTDSQQVLVFGKLSRTKWILTWWSRSTLRSCAWTPVKVNYAAECWGVWNAFSNVKRLPVNLLVTKTLFTSFDFSQCRV